VANLALFKSPEQVLQSGNDAVLRGSFAEAVQNYKSASVKFSKQGNMMMSRLADGYAAIVAIAQSPSNTSLYYPAAQSVRSLGDITLKLGLREISAPALAGEIQLLASEIDVLNARAATSGEHADKAQRLRELAMRFRTEASETVLVLPELFLKQSVLGESKALSLSAHAEEELGESLVMNDPKAAAEHYQTARLLWMQAGRQELADGAASRVRSYGMSARCWFCGREISGEGVHFLSMPSDLTDLVKKTAKDSALPAFDPSQARIYACKGCHSAIYKMADTLAIERMRELEMRINVQLNQIRESIAETQRMIARMR
jgi:hypothetical protein